MNDLRGEFKYFSVHSVKALEAKQFSVILGNVECTEDKLRLAISLYPAEDYFIDYHNEKINMGVIV